MPDAICADLHRALAGAPILVEFMRQRRKPDKMTPTKALAEMPCKDKPTSKIATTTKLGAEAPLALQEGSAIKQHKPTSQARTHT